MAELRTTNPYPGFNFLVNLGDGVTEGAEAGFSESSLLAQEVGVVEYRNGNSRENGVQKITGLNKVTDVTLKRGVIGSLSLYRWFDAIRDGQQDTTRTVTIQLLSEDHRVVLTWTLLGAKLTKLSTGTFNAATSAIAVEEAVLCSVRVVQG